MPVPTRLLAVLPVAAVLALSGCGTTEGGPAAGAPTSTSTSSATSSAGDLPSAATPGTGAPFTKGPFTKGHAPGREITVSGVVGAGVESGCLVLSAKGRTYLLLGGKGRLEVGQQVQVVGRLVPDAVTTCQQGTGLAVESVTSP